jgi:hypothetical protein
VEPFDLLAVALAAAFGALVVVILTGSSPILVVPVALVVAGVAAVRARGARAGGANAYGQHPDEHVTTGH